MKTINLRDFYSTLYNQDAFYDVHIEKPHAVEEKASIYVEKELCGASKDAMGSLGTRDILFVFSPVMSCPKRVSRKRVFGQ